MGSVPPTHAKKPHSTNDGASPVLSELCPPGVWTYLYCSYFSAASQILSKAVGMYKRNSLEPNELCTEKKNIRNPVHAGATQTQGKFPVLSELLTVLSYSERHCQEKRYQHAGAYLWVRQDRTQAILLPDEVRGELQTSTHASP